MTLAVRLTVCCDGCRKTAPVTVDLRNLLALVSSPETRFYPDGWSHYIDVDLCPACKTKDTEVRDRVREAQRW